MLVSSETFTNQKKNLKSALIRKSSQRKTIKRCLRLWNLMLVENIHILILHTRPLMLAWNSGLKLWCWKLYLWNKCLNIWYWKAFALVFLMLTKSIGFLVKFVVRVTQAMSEILISDWLTQNHVIEYCVLIGWHMRPGNLLMMRWANRKVFNNSVSSLETLTHSGFVSENISTHVVLWKNILSYLKASASSSQYQASLQIISCNSCIDLHHHQQVWMSQSVCCSRNNSLPN